MRLDLKHLVSDKNLIGKKIQSILGIELLCGCSSCSIKLRTCQFCLTDFVEPRYRFKRLKSCLALFFLNLINVSFYSCNFIKSIIHF